MKKNYTYKIYKDGRVVSRLSCHSIRRFLSRLRTINFSNDIEKVYLRVSYGKSKYVIGKLSTNFNDGYFENHENLLQAFEAFSEVDI